MVRNTAIQWRIVVARATDLEWLVNVAKVDVYCCVAIVVAFATPMAPITACHQLFPTCLINGKSGYSHHPAKCAKSDTYRNFKQNSYVLFVWLILFVHFNGWTNAGSFLWFLFIKLLEQSCGFLSSHSNQQIHIAIDTNETKEWKKKEKIK